MYALPTLSVTLRSPFQSRVAPVVGRRALARRIVVVSLAMCATPLAAQSTPPGQSAGRAAGQPAVTAGIKAGLNVAHLSNEVADSGTRVGLIAGGFVGRRLSSVLGLQVEALYSSKGEKLPFSSATLAIDYLEIPVLATFSSAARARIRPVFVTGPVLAFTVRTRYADAPDAFQTTFREFVHATEFGWVVGGGIELPLTRGSVVLEGRYTFGLTPVFDADPMDSDADKRNRVLSLLLGYRLK